MVSRGLSGRDFSRILVTRRYPPPPGV